jgi:mono/diheme cytochrome c family protein
MTRAGRVGVVLLLLVAGLAAWFGLDLRGPSNVVAEHSMAASTPQELDRGAYLARAGNCQHCHTQRGGAPYAGGRAIDTPFGVVYTSNLTSDAKTGLGRWTSEDFWQALHHGRSRDGRWLLPAFPYNNFTYVSRADSDALFAWLQSLPAVPQANLSHALRWPFGTQGALGVWRALYFRAEPFQADAARSAQWNRGAYLVQGLGHCSACHAARNALGAVSDASHMAGGLMPMGNWYVPSLASRAEAGVQDWDGAQIVQLLQTGTAPNGWATGPMAEVVLHSTQYLVPADLDAMARFLKDLPDNTVLKPPQSSGPAADAALHTEGARVYEKHCAQCHGADGQGVPKAYPALAGSRSVNMASPVNLVQVVLNGGFPAATTGHPRPFGMPPLALVLSDREIAAVLSHIRSAWGNLARDVTPQDVDALRSHAAR